MITDISLTVRDRGLWWCLDHISDKVRISSIDNVRQAIIITGGWLPSTDSGGGSMTNYVHPSFHPTQMPAMVVFWKKFIVSILCQFNKNINVFSCFRTHHTFMSIVFRRHVLIDSKGLGLSRPGSCSSARKWLEVCSVLGSAGGVWRSGAGSSWSLDAMSYQEEGEQLRQEARCALLALSMLRYTLSRR